MSRYFRILLFFGLVFGEDCTADNGTDDVELWSECYSIEDITGLELLVELTNRLC